MKHILAFIIIAVFLTSSVLAEVTYKDVMNASTSNKTAQYTPQNNTKTLTITPVNITGHNETDITKCSFYTEGESFDQMRERCNTEATQVLIGANFGLQDEIKACEDKYKGYIWNRNVTWFAVGIAIILLVWKTKELFFKKK